MNGEPQQHFGGDRASAVLTRIIEVLPDCPAMVFSRFGEVLLRTGPALALFGEHDRGLAETGGTDRRHLRRYRHAELGELELYRQILVDPVAGQVLVVFAAVPGSPSDEKIRRLTSTGR